MFRRTAFIGAVLVALGAPAAAQNPQVTLRISNFNPPQNPMSVALTAWAGDVEKASKGSIKLQLFHAQQLGRAFDQYDMVRDGIADMAYVVPGYQPGRFPLIAAVELPFVLTNGIEGTVGVDRWYRRYAENELKDVKFCFAFVGQPITFNSKKEIRRPADLQGMKVRPAQATAATWVASVGGTNVQAAAPEVRDVVEKGAVDVVTWTYGTLVQYGVDKFTKFHTDLPLLSTAFVYVINKRVYANFSPDQKSAIDAHCNSDAARRVGKQWADFENEGEANLRSRSDHKFVKLTPEEVEAWRVSGEPLTQKWKDTVRPTGNDPDKLLSDLRATLKEAGAAY